MTKRIINLLFFIVLSIFVVSVSGIIPLFAVGAEADLTILSVSYSPYFGLTLTTNDESQNFKIDENFISVFDGDNRIALFADESTNVNGSISIPVAAAFSDLTKAKVVFGKGFAVSENGARLSK